MNPESPHRDSPSCTSAQLLISLSSSHSLAFFSGQGSLLQSSESELGFCKLFRENSFLEVFSISLWSDLLLYKCHRAWQNCSIFFCITVSELRIWPKCFLQAVIQFSLLLREKCPLREPNKNPKLSLSQVRQCICTDELMIMKKITLCGWVRKQKMSACTHFCNSLDSVDFTKVENVFLPTQLYWHSLPKKT